LSNDLDLNRKSKYTVLITTSGIGSRLGNQTLYTNKSLLILGKKPAIAHIIEKYPEDTTFVITIGYFGNHVKEFLELSYPERNFTFVDVKPFSGPKSSLGYSIYCAREVLQKPFIYHACDTLILDEAIPEPSSNWVAGFKGNDAANYASFEAQGNLIEKFNAKGMTNFDFIHIGLVAVKSYKEFWHALESLLNSGLSNSELNDVSVLELLAKENVKFRVEKFKSWIDIGNSNSLVAAKKLFGGNFNVLEKPQESISFVKNFVVKFFADQQIVANRVTRMRYLGDTVPKLRDSSNNFYSYEFQHGDTLANSLNPKVILNLLTWMKLNLWSLKPKIHLPEFKSMTEAFYIEKSNIRLQEFIESRLVSDEASEINGQFTPSAKDLINKAKPLLLEDSEIGGFHGDFILDNIIISSSVFKLIDWRQDFAGNLEFGDIYYDLAKLNHSFHINHELVMKGNYFVELNDSKIECSILRKDVHVEMERYLKDFVKKEGLNWNKIEILTSMIWLNMAPLHHHPFDKFLYYYGRYNLWRSLNDKV
jgi:choline kinase